ncbi:MAG: CAP domain-containing protein [Elainellaceae cyanobacterium]
MNGTQTVLWSDASEWLGFTPKDGDDVTIPTGLKVILDQDTPELGTLAINGILEFDQKDLKLTADNVLVFGEMAAGSEENPHTHKTEIVLTGKSTDPDVVLADWMGEGHGMHDSMDGGEHANHMTSPINNKAVIVAPGGKLNLHGAEVDSWTQLDSTANAGDTSITLAEIPAGWNVGDAIAIAPTDFSVFEVEERTIAKIEGSTVFFEEPLEYRHYGEQQDLGNGKVLDMRAEVTNLTRNISITGSDEGESQILDTQSEHPDYYARAGYGGHTVYLTGAEVKIDGVEFNGLGNSGELGNYPVHFHHTGDASGSYVKNSSVHHTFQRGLVVHRADNLLIEGNTIFETMSHSYYIEDGVETGNRFVDNLAMMPRMTAEAFRIDSEKKSPERPTGFWITNQTNAFEGNHAVGIRGGQGFWFNDPDKVSGTGLARKKDTPLLQFEGNTAHTINFDRVEGLGYPPKWTGIALDIGKSFDNHPDSAPIKDFTAWKIGNMGITIGHGDEVDIENPIIAETRVFLHTKDGDPLKIVEPTFVAETENTVEGRDIRSIFPNHPKPVMVEAARPTELVDATIIGADQLVESSSRPKHEGNLTVTLAESNGTSEETVEESDTAEPADDAAESPQDATSLDLDNEDMAADNGGEMQPEEDFASEIPNLETSSPEMPSSESDNPTGENGLMKFYLINAETNQLIKPLTSGESVDPNAIAAKEFSIVAEPDAGVFNQVGSIKFFLNGKAVKTENTPPYALFGDRSGDFHGEAFEDGAFTLEVEAYSGPDGTGDKLVAAELTYDVAVGTPDTTAPDSGNTAVDTDGSDQPTENPEPEAPNTDGDAVTDESAEPTEGDVDGSVDMPTQTDGEAGGATDGADDSPTDGSPTSEVPAEPDTSGSESGGGLKLYLVDAGTDEIIEELTSGKSIDADTTGADEFSIIAVPDSSQVESVKFFLNGQEVRTENTPPYALFGDTDGNFRGELLEDGAFTVAAEAYSGQNATGEKLSEVELSYEVSGAAAPTSSAPIAETPTEGGGTPTTPEDGIDTGSGDLGADPTPPTTNPDALVSQFDHIVSHFDGNNRDTDDIAALPIAAALTNASGLQDKSTFFYGNNIGEPNIERQVEDMRASAAFAEKLGIKTHDYQSGLNQTTDELVKIFNSGQKVLVLEGGRMEMTYRAFEKTDPDKIKNITLLSHSTNNENYTRNGSRTWSDLKADFPEATFIDIENQNGTNDRNGFNSSKWNWLDSTSDPLLQELREHMLEAGRKYNEDKFNDPSDAGMHFFAITGNENGDPLDAKAFLEANPPSFTSSPQSTPVSTPEPSPEPVPVPTSTDTSSDSLVFMAENGQVVIEAENTELQGHWTPRMVDGEDTVLWDPAYSKAARGEAGETLSYSFVTDEAGDYNLAMRFGRVKDAMSDRDLLENGQERTDTGNDSYISLINAETGEVIQDQVKASTYLGRSDEELKWGTTISVNHQKSPATFKLDANTEYRLEVTGRSDGYALDRITLSTDGFLTDANVPQSSTQVGANDTAVLSSGPASASPALSTVESVSPEFSDSNSDFAASELSQEVLELTNAFRAKNGLAPLSLNQDLTEAAQDHVQDMAEGDFFSHTGLDESTIVDRVQEAGYMPQTVGENIAAGQITAEEVVQAWIDSPGHRANLLNDQFTEIGIGYAFLENDTGSVNYNHYWGQAFGQSSEASDFGAVPQSSGDFVRAMAEAGFSGGMGSMGDATGGGQTSTFESSYGLANLESASELQGAELFSVSEGIGNQTETHQDELTAAHICGTMAAFPMPEVDSLAA